MIRAAPIALAVASRPPTPSPLPSTPKRPYAHTPIRPYAHTPIRPYAHTPITIGHPSGTKPLPLSINLPNISYLRAIRATGYRMTLASIIALNWHSVDSRLFQNLPEGESGQGRFE